MVDAYIVSNLQESVGLTDEQFVKVLPLVKRLQEQWADLVDVDPGQITLHYLRGRLQIDLLLPLTVFETHPDPEKALSDGPNSWPLDLMEPLLATLAQLDELVKKAGLLEDA